MPRLSNPPVGAASGNVRRPDPENVLESGPYRRASVADGELRYLRAGSGRTIVLLHTLRTQLEYWMPLLRQLGSDFDIVAPDLPGHGESTAPRARYSATYFTDVTEQFLGAARVRDAIVVGESIGGSIALGLAARGNTRVSRVIAINPYDYGRGGGIRRSSALANLLFAMFQWPVIGPLIVRAGTTGILRRVLEGGLRDRRHLSAELVDALWECGSLPGHSRAFLSLSREWRSWIDVRAAYARIQVPVTLVYGDHDWSLAEEREANAHALPAARRVPLVACGHFASLERPAEIAELIREEAAEAAA